MAETSIKQLEAEIEQLNRLVFSFCLLSRFSVLCILLLYHSLIRHSCWLGTSKRGGHEEQ